MKPPKLSSSSAKSFDKAKHPHGAGGRFAETGGTQLHTKLTVGAQHLKTSGVTGADQIVVLSSRVRKYKGFATVEAFVAAHPKGRAHALRLLAADHRKGLIGFASAAVAARPAKSSGISPTDEISVLSPKVKKYAEHATVGSFVDSHPKGRAHAMKLLAADHKAGRIAIHGPAPKEAAAGRYNVADYADFSDADDKTITEVERNLYKGMLATPENASEIKSINKYSGSSYAGINALLRARQAQGNAFSLYSHPSFGADIKNIDQVMKRSRMPENTLVYRGVKGDIAAKLRSLPIGSEFKDQGYTSTSLRRSVAGNNFGGESGVVLKLLLPKSSPAYIMNGRGASRFPKEHEVLLPRGSRFRIVGRKGNEITAEVL